MGSTLNLYNIPVPILRLQPSTSISNYAPPREQIVSWRSVCLRIFCRKVFFRGFSSDFYWRILKPVPRELAHFFQQTLTIIYISFKLRSSDKFGIEFGPLYRR